MLNRLLNILFHRSFIEWLKNLKKLYLICRVVPLQKRALARLEKKDSIKCVFFALFEEVWKYDRVYQLMLGHPRFNPVILVCPIVNYGRDNMLQRMEQSYRFFSKKRYHVIKAYDDVNDKYVDVIQDMSPDIIFYTNPYKGLIDDRYYIDNFPDILTAYVPYFFHEGVGYEVAYNSLFQNVLWRRYSETSYHKELSVEFSSNDGRNNVVVGYPGIEELIYPSKTIRDNMWKQAKTRKKRIIWAPHHTLEAVGTCNYSCFLCYADFMLRMAEKYCDIIQLVFKPHPLLRNKLDMLWGEKKTGAYYERWESMPNTSLQEGEYIDLFLTSDAMIHDSGSFLIEYLYVNKPVMRTLNGIPLEKMYNPFALKCLEQYYMAYSENDIEMFIKNVINNVDPLKEQRTKFINEVLMPKGSPSQNIVDDILDSIDNQILYRN